MWYKNFSKITLVCFLLLFFYVSAYAVFNVRRSTSTVRVKDGGNFVIEQPIADFKGTLETEAGGTVSGEAIEFTDGTYKNDGSKMKMTGELNVSSAISAVLNGGKTFKGKRGQVVKRLSISGKHNRLEGVLLMTDDITLQDSNTSVTCAIQGRLASNIVLNGGRVFLEEDLHFVDDVFFSGDGVVALNKRNLHLGSKEMTCDAAIYFDEAQDIEMHANLHLAQTWTFSGTSVLEGNGRILYLEDDGELVIEQGSSLLLRDVTIRKVSGNKVKCLDSNATVSFQNVNWIQDGNYSFTTGSLEVIENFYLKGNSVFAYQSAQTSTIWGHGKLVVDRGMTFSFDPICSGMTAEQWENARNLLTFEDATSVLELKGSTLHVTSTNLKLTKGTLRVKDKSYIVSELDGDFHMEEGLILGNNNAADDMKVEIGVGARLEVSDGALSYKNMQTASWDMSNNVSTLHIFFGGKLKLHQTLDVGSGIVSFSDGSRLARAFEKRLDGAVHMLGSVYYECCYN